MNLYFRFFYALIAALFKKKIPHVMDESRLRFRVLPTDLDLNGHMNNGRYPTIMDIGRIDLVMRTGMLKPVLKRGLIPVLSSVMMRYRLPLMPFQRYDLTSRIICWDEKWAYMEHRFIITSGKKAGAVAAIGIAKGSFFDRKARATIPTREVMDMISQHIESPPFPEYIVKWQEGEDALREETGQRA